MDSLDTHSYGLALGQIYLSLSLHSIREFVGGKKPVEHHSPVWVPDNEANICMHCKRTQFTMLQRRVSLRARHCSARFTRYLTLSITICICSIIVGIVALLCAGHVHRRSSCCRRRVRNRYAFVCNVTIR